MTSYWDGSQASALLAGGGLKQPAADGTSCIQESLNNLFFLKKWDKVKKGKKWESGQNLGQNKQSLEGSYESKGTCLGCWLHRFLLRARPKRQSDMAVPSPTAWPFASPSSLTVRLLNTQP